MLQKYNTYWSEIDDNIATPNTPAATRDGILLGQSVGADLVGMGFSQMMPVSDPVTGALFHRSSSASSKLYHGQHQR